MRDLSANALTKLAATHGNEGVVILDIEWVDGSVSRYADRDISTHTRGRILEVSNLDNVINVSQSADSQEISVVLDDTDGSIKSIMDNHDIHKRDAWVYQWFEGLDFDDRFLLFRGKVNSPLSWKEGDRTVSFTVISQLEDNEIGFSPEEGEFPNIPDELVGQPWPMCFGTVLDSRTVRLTTRLDGVLGDGIGFPDFALPHRAQALRLIVEYGKPTILGFQAVLDWVKTSPHWQQANDVSATYDEQEETIRNSFRVFGGEQFPRGEITLDIGQANLVGHFSDNRFWLKYTGSDYDKNHPERSKFPLRFNIFKSEKKFPHAEIVTPTITVFQAGDVPRLISLDPYPTGNVIGDNAGYVYLEPGATVKLASAEPQTYVVSIVPGTVKRVSAWMEREGQRFIQDVPSDLYTVHTETYGSVTAVLVTLHDALSKREGEGWSDEIYVTFQSDVGPNTVDVLEYLIQTYTDLAIDSTSFTQVKSRLTNYPSHFAIYDRRNVLDVLEDIAWQARCAIWLKDGKFYIRYLPEQPTPAATITEDDILLDSMEVYHSDTEDIVTKLVGRWQESYIQEKPYQTILRHNVAKYGTQELDREFWIYNYKDAVIKSGTHWLIYLANTWKRVRFRTAATKLHIETLDPISLASSHVADDPVVAIVESADYDSDSNTIAFDVWCPVKAGERGQYLFAYSGDAPEHATFPTDVEIQRGFDGGNSYGKNAVGELPERLTLTRGGRRGGGSQLGLSTYDNPIGDPYNLNYANRRVWDEENQRWVYETPRGGTHGLVADGKSTDIGNRTPSDAGDSYPGPHTIRPSESFGASNPGPASPQANGARIPEPDGYGGKARYPGAPEQGPGDGDGGVDDGGEFDPNDLPKPEDVPNNPCNHTVYIWYYERVDHVSQGGYQYPPGYNQCGTQGKPVRGVLTPPDEREEFVFNTCQAARAFCDSMQDYMAGENAVVCAPFPYQVQNCPDCASAPPCDSPIEAGNDFGMVGYRPPNVDSSWAAFATWSEG